MQNLLKGLEQTYILSIFFPILTIGLPFYIEHKIKKAFEMRGKVVSRFQRYITLVALFIPILLLFVLIWGSLSEGGLNSFLGDDPISFIKHLFGY